MAPFAAVSDPWAALGVRRRSEAFLMVALYVLRCEADDWVMMEEHGEARTA